MIGSTAGRSCRPGGWGSSSNCHVDTVHLFAPITTRWDPGSQAAAWASLRQGLAAFPDRVLFGTEHPAGTGTLATMHDDVGTFGLDPAVAARVLGGNARRLAAAAGAPA